MLESAAFNMPANLEYLVVATRLKEDSFHSNPKERQCQKLLKIPHNCTNLTRYQSNAQILQVRLQQQMNRELPNVQAGFRKGKGTRDQMPTSTGSLKKQESSRKISTSALLTMPKPLTVWVTTNYGKFLKQQYNLIQIHNPLSETLGAKCILEFKIWGFQKGNI